MDGLGLTIASCAYWTLLGWVLSAAHALGSAGYAVGLAGFLALARVVGCHALLPAPRTFLRRTLRRARQPLPALFLALALASLVGGLLYEPSNHDALSYRLPKLFHWLWEGSAVWVDTPFEATNYTASNHEWLGLPLFALTRSLRPYFLLNWVAFCCLPGLVFRVLSDLAVSPRVAATWMWILPSGYGYALQSGGIGNDLLAAFYLLAALVFAARARRGEQPRDVLLAAIAVALATGVKLSNLPLLLPVACVLGPAAVRRVPRGLRALAGFAAVVGVSALPVLARNIEHTGSWMGTTTASDRARSFGAGVIGNALATAADHLNPPLSPFAAARSAALMRALPASVAAYLKESYPRWAIRLNELPQEERAGLGFGVAVLVLALVLGLGRGPYARPPRWAAWAVLGNALGYLLLLGMLAIGTTRIALPYYPLLLVPLLWLDAARRRSTQRGFRALAQAAMLSSLVAVILQPARPLWPALRTLDALALRWPSPTLARARAAYAVYRARPRALTPLVADLPPGACMGALIGADVLEGTLWLPGARRCVQHLPLDGAAAALARRGLRWLVVRTAYAGAEAVPALEAQGLAVRAVADVPLFAEQPAERFVLLEAAPPPAGGLRLRADGGTPPHGHR